MLTQTEHTLPTARPDVVLRRVGNEWVLFDSAHGRAHVLNLAAAVIWTYCDGAHEPDAIVEAIVRAVTDGAAPPPPTADRVRSDIAVTLRRFADEGLLQ